MQTEYKGKHSVDHSVRQTDEQINRQTDRQMDLQQKPQTAWVSNKIKITDQCRAVKSFHDISSLLTVNTERSKGKFANTSWLLSLPPSLFSSLPLLPHSIHPPLSLSSIWLTSDAVVSFFSTSALHHPLPAYPLGAVLVVYVEGGGWRGREPMVSFSLHDQFIIWFQVRD